MELDALLAHPKTIPMVAIALWTCLAGLGIQLWIDSKRRRGESASSWAHLGTLALFVVVGAINQSTYRTTSYEYIERTGDDSLSTFYGSEVNFYVLMWLAFIVAGFIVRHLVNQSQGAKNKP